MCTPACRCGVGTAVLHSARACLRRLANPARGCAIKLSRGPLPRRAWAMRSEKSPTGAFARRRCVHGAARRVAARRSAALQMLEGGWRYGAARKCSRLRCAAPWPHADSHTDTCSFPTVSMPTCRPDTSRAGRGKWARLRRHACVAPNLKILPLPEEALHRPCPAPPGRPYPAGTALPCPALPCRGRPAPLGLGQPWLVRERACRTREPTRT